MASPVSSWSASETRGPSNLGAGLQARAEQTTLNAASRGPLTLDTVAPTRKPESLPERNARSMLRSTGENSVVLRVDGDRRLRSESSRR